jgi:hypothetical protein
MKGKLHGWTLFDLCSTVWNKELPNYIHTYIYMWIARLGLETYIPVIQQCFK